MVFCDDQVETGGISAWYRSADGSEDGKVEVNTSNSRLYGILDQDTLSILYPRDGPGVTGARGGLYSCDTLPLICILVYCKFPGQFS